MSMQLDIGHMKLYLVRHATATEGIGGPIHSDAERPLITIGREEAQSVAIAIRRLGAKPDVFLTSPLVRAKQTAEIFAEMFGQKDKLQLTDALAPGGTVSDLYKALKNLGRANEVFLFGHQPDMTRLAQTLLWSGPDLDLPFKKAAVCRIDIYDCPPTNPGTLKWLITPKIASMMSGR
jgi:phosphohistidine phosphatase